MHVSARRREFGDRQGRGGAARQAGARAAPRHRGAGRVGGARRGWRAMMQALRRWSFVLGWNLVAAALIIELGGRALHWADHGTLRMRAEAPAPNPAPVEPFSVGDVRPLLHPYFGFVYGAPTDPGADRNFYVNNHSFVQDRGYVERHPGCCEYPVTSR